MASSLTDAERRDLAPFADELMSRGTPVILATGYAQSHIPKRYSDLPQLTKPVRETALVRLIEHTFRR